MARDTEQTDRELVSAFLATRSEASFRQLYRRHAPLMLRLANSLTAGSASSVEDVVQEAWIRAVSTLERFEWRSSLRSWLGGFILNVVREGRRSAGRGPNEVPVGDVVAGDPLLLQIEVREALEQLPPGFRSVVALHDIAGFTHEEIGQILGVDPGTSKSQLARARQRLRSLIGASFFHDG